MVLVCTLECVYALTSLGDRACEAVARVPGLPHTLVALVTVEVSVWRVCVRVCERVCVRVCERACVRASSIF